MTSEARFTFDEDYLLESLRMNRRQRKGRYVFSALKWTTGTVFAGMSAVLFAGGNIAAGSVLIPIILLLLFAHRLDEPSVKRRFRRSPYYGSSVRLVFSPERVEIAQEKARTELAWSVFTRAVIFAEGALLFQGDGLFNWLPRRAFPEPAGYENLLRLIDDKVPDIKRVR